MWRHFKIAYDPNFDYVEICGQLYSVTGKWLCVVEKLDTNAHVHFHGETDLTEDMFKNRVSDLMKDHWKRRVDPNCRPVRHSNKEADEAGLQYLMKEPKSVEHVLSRNNITDEDLEALKAASDQYVTEVKNGLRDHLHKLPDQPDDPVSLHALYRYEGCEYYEQAGKFFPPNFQKLVLHAMYTKAPPCKKRKVYVSERI